MPGIWSPATGVEYGRNGDQLLSRVRNRMLDRLTGMQVFSQAAALGSLSAAARALAMSPAMATRHVDALEARLGVKLLHRSTRRLILTEAGGEYLAASRRILRSEEHTYELQSLMRIA